MSERLGKDAKLYRSANLLTAANDAAVTGATWVEVDEVKNVNLDGPASEADKTTRASGGWKQTASTQRDLAISFDLHVPKAGSTNYEAIRAAYVGSTEIAMLALDMDKDTTKAEGPASNWTITGLNRTEELENVVVYSVTAKPSSFTQWHVSAGA